MRKISSKPGSTAKVLLVAGIVGAGLHTIPSSSAQSRSVITQSKISLPLVTNKQVNAIIVIANKPTKAAAQGAQVLADHIRQISGAEMEVTSEGNLKDAAVKDGKISADVGEKSTFILVGESTLAQKLDVTAEGLGSGGIRQKTVGNALILLGADNVDTRPTIEISLTDASQQTTNDRNATLYAVTKFLEDQLGVRYLWPGEKGKVIPKLDSIAIGRIDVSYTPQIKQRHIRHNLSGSFSARHQVGLQQLGVAEEDYSHFQKGITDSRRTISTSPDWYTWQGLGGSLGLKTGHSFGYAWEKYGKDHPEWFALQPNGSRDQSGSPGRARFAVANKDLQAAIARDRIEELDRNPDQVSVSIDPNDGGYTIYDTSDEARKLDPPNAKLGTYTWTDRLSEDKKTYIYQRPISITDRMVYFWNGITEKIVEKHPDAITTVRAYSDYVEPPVMRKLHPNIAVEQVSGDYFDEDSVAKHLANWTEWSKFTQRLSWRPNIDNGARRHGMPVIYVHRMAKDVKARARAGMTGTDVDSLHKNWAINSLNIYVLAKLFWDPSLDVDAIVDDYCEAGFKEGAPYIKKYFSRIEEITMKAADAGVANPEKNSRGRYMITVLAQQYNPTTLKELNELLDQAKEATHNDKDIAQRIEFMRLGLLYTDVQAAAFRMVDEANEANKRIDKKAVLPFMEKRYKVMRSIFFNEPTALDIPYLLWGSEGNFRALKSKESWMILADGTNDKELKSAEVVADEYGQVED